MTAKEVLGELEAMGDEKVYARNERNGAGKEQYGVKLGDIRKLAKRIKQDHELALELWKTKNLEARLLAIIVMKPEVLSTTQLDEMVKTFDVPQLADWFNMYVLKDHPEKDSLREQWMNSENVWAARSGWSLTAGKVARDNEKLDLDRLLDRIEAEMPHAAPQVQWTMNTALAQIGIKSVNHRERAIAIGEKLGIYKDYPVSKGCTSPFAPIWINEMVSRQKD
ncbi:DNA alkylation repair protein [Antarcticibacterium flavum]|uniref:DNA alkylation repair protein n=1 Tax=Antarcticibacterium flavum TaxID=2058175 RepID=A0A5B7X8T1_9FLAO|nr:MULTISPECIES: DNA alkylation repair protein [Antarcticibacterium]MCM4159244.1 DNA alkylation repair protein [Antarcticibacterium sp. W02-3]QCY71041.1 DNA alkylation repair protein [Antarcticibacterium flavum]